MKASFFLLKLGCSLLIYAFAGVAIDFETQGKVFEVLGSSPIQRISFKSIFSSENEGKNALKVTEVSNSSLNILQEGFLSEDQQILLDVTNNLPKELEDDSYFFAINAKEEGTSAPKDNDNDNERLKSLFEFAATSAYPDVPKKSLVELELEEKISSNTVKSSSREYNQVDYDLHNSNIGKQMVPKTNQEKFQDYKTIHLMNHDISKLGYSGRNAELIAEVLVSERKNFILSHDNSLKFAPQHSDQNSKIKVQKKRIAEERFAKSNAYLQIKATNDSNIRYYTPSQWKLNNWSSVFVIFLIGFTIIFAIFLSEIIESLLNNDLKKTLDSIFRDTIVLTVITMFSGILNYYDLLSFVKYYINFEAAGIGLLIFAALWAGLGLLLVLLAHTYIKDWRTYEREYQKREAIFRHFEDLYYNPHRTSELNAELKNRRRQLEFFLIRQEFITPSFLPILGEDFLRDDFDFASYLAKCISKLNQEAFRFDFVTFITFSLAIGASAGLYYYMRHLLIKIIIFSPLILYIPLRILARKMTRIYGQLVTVVRSPYDIDLAKFENLRQPLINLDKLSMPAYLTSRVSSRHFRRTCSIVQLANRHMILYWFSSPRFMIRMLHVILVLHLQWVTYLVVSLSFGIEKLQAYYYWIGLGVSILVSLINLFYMLPQILRLSAIVNNIQMLKDRDLRREVIEEKMQGRTINMRNIYSILKTVKRQSIIAGKDNNLRLFIIEFVRELFQELRGPQKEKSITCSDLTALAHLCGRDLSDREATILAHDITCKSPADISLEEFMDAVEKISGDVKSNPVEVSKTMLKELTSLENTTISSRNLRIALEKLDLLEDREIEFLIHEIKYLPVLNAEYNISHISTLIRDSVEGMPR